MIHAIRFAVLLALTGCGRLDFADVSGCATCDTGLIAHWRLDDAAGMRAHDELGNHDGFLHGNPTWTTGHLGGAIALASDGDDVELEWNFAAATPGAFTVAEWVQPTAGSQFGFDRYLSSYWYAMPPDGTGVMEVDAAASGSGLRCEFRLGTSLVQATAADGVTPGTWHHVACTYDGGHLSAAIDGVVRDTIAITGMLVPNASYPIAFGTSTNRTAYQNTFTGAIDDVRIYDRALTVAELAALAGQ